MKLSSSLLNGFRFFRRGVLRPISRVTEGGGTRHLSAAHNVWQASLRTLTTSIPNTQADSTSSGGTTLKKVMEGKSAKRVLLEENIVPGVARPSPLFRLAIRCVYEELCKLQQKSKFHGNLTAENISYADFNVANLDLIGFSGIAGDIADDFKSLRKIIIEVFRISNCNMDPETSDFIQFLESGNIGKKHYWTMNVKDRERFFLDIHRNCLFTIREIFDCRAPDQVPLCSSKPSKYFKVFVDQNQKRNGRNLVTDPLIWKKVKLSFATELIRHYFEHYGHVDMPYNELSLQTVVNLHQAELDFYCYYPGYFPGLYKALQRLKIEYLL